MSQNWEVIGGGDKGGIVVRKGKGLKSDELPIRLSTGSVVEELSFAPDLYRLNYKLICGSGPEEGWVSTQLKGKPLLKRLEAKQSSAEPIAVASDIQGEVVSDKPASIEQKSSDECKPASIEKAPESLITEDDSATENMDSPIDKPASIEQKSSDEGKPASNEKSPAFIGPEFLVAEDDSATKNTHSPIVDLDGSSKQKLVVENEREPAEDTDNVTEWKEKKADESSRSVGANAKEEAKDQTKDEPEEKSQGVPYIIRCAECGKIFCERADDGCSYCDRCWLAWTTNDDILKAVIQAEKKLKTKAAQAAHEKSSSCAATSTAKTLGVFSLHDADFAAEEDINSEEENDWSDEALSVESDGPEISTQAKVTDAALPTVLTKDSETEMPTPPNTWEMRWDQIQRMCYWIDKDGEKTCQDPRPKKTPIQAAEKTSDLLNELAQKGSGARRIAKLSKKIFVLPLTYEVITDNLDTHVNPAPDAAVAMTEPSAQHLQGFPAGAWIHLVAEDDHFENCWALLFKGTDKHFQMEPLWGRVQATRDCEGHLHIFWPGVPLPAGAVTYRIRWRAMDENMVAGPSGIFDVGLLNFDRLPLPPRVVVQVRATCVAAGEELRMEGAWSERFD